MVVGQQGVVFESRGARLVGVLFTGGEGPRPTVIALHGMPGIEQNHDLIYALRSAGWNALLFHYRGSWGSEGDFTMRGTAEDALAALDHLTSGAFADVVDPANLFLFGFSMGGWAAVVSGSDPRVRAVCAVAPVVHSDGVEFTAEDAGSAFTPWLNGVTPAGFVQQWRDLPSSLEVVGDLNKPLLVIHGERDDVIPFSHGEALYSAAKEPKSFIGHSQADHSFQPYREWLITRVTGWLKEIAAGQAGSSTSNPV